LGTAHTDVIAGTWPIRAGAFARYNTTRFEAGATFWGVLNMSDNVAERFVSFGFATGSTIGRDFTGAHGDGNLTGGGLADVPCWPGRNLGFGNVNVIGGTGSGYRGIGLLTANTVNAWTTATASNRANMGGAAGNAANHNTRDPWTGMRGGRSVPIEFSILRSPATENRAAIQAGLTGGVGAIFTHTLAVSAIGQQGDLSFQWFWTDGDTADGVLIDGATAPTFQPPSTVPHEPRFFFARVTDGLTGQVVTSGLSGRHTVMGVATHPSTTNLTTSMTQGTDVLTVAASGGVGPFTVQWFFLLNGTPGAVSTAGTLIPNAVGVNATYRPVIPLPGNNYTFFATIRDEATGVTVRTAQSGIHTVGIPVAGGNNGVWVGAGQGATLTGSQGSVATAPIPVDLAPGVWRLEAWGASGGQGHSVVTTMARSAWGGYTQTHIRVEVPTRVYVLPGGAGANSLGFGFGERVPGGWNGGGDGFVNQLNTASQHGSGGGGGASHISLASGQLNSAPVRAGIIIVAGGGGGSAPNNTSNARGGTGGGLSGANAVGSGGGLGGTQAAGGAMAAGGIHGVLVANATVGVAGLGGDGMLTTTIGAGGGGGGWFGGSGGRRRTASTASTGGGGGGSGHIAPAFTHTLGSIVPLMPASATNAPSAGGTAAVNIPNPTGAATGTTPRHPGDNGVAASNANVLGGAIRIMRMQ